MFVWDHVLDVEAMRLDVHDPWVLLGLELVTSVRTGEPVAALGGATFRPAPVQRPRPPVWVAATSEPDPRAAEAVDGTVWT